MDDPNLSDVVKRIPNIKKLEMVCSAKLLERVIYVSYLECFSKLESLKLSVAYSRERKYLLKMSFPPSLKKLNLCIPISSEWEDILPTIGSLPLLQKLTLYFGRFRTRKWETIEGQFPSLKSLKLWECNDLEKWIMLESSHFHVLQELYLALFKELKEIPSEIGEIPTLISIKLYCCNESVVLSAKRILDEQEELHGDQPDLRVSVNAKAVQELATSNFKVTIQ